MTLQTLEYFIAVAQHRNFTQAARACHVTQPALSRAVHALEEELGCQLLVRAGRSVALTHEGEVCLIEAKRLLQQREELVARVREAEWQNRRPLRMGYVIASFLNTFLQQVGGQSSLWSGDPVWLGGGNQKVAAGQKGGCHFAAPALYGGFGGGGVDTAAVGEKRTLCHRS